MKRMIAVAMLGTALGGCATPGEIMNRKPEFDYVTPKAPAEVIACITDKWRDRRLEFTQVKTEEGWALNWLAGVGGAGVALVWPEGAGSRVMFMRRDLWVLETGGMCVRDCR